MIPKIEGLIAATFTPMREDGSLNLEVIPRYYNMLKRNKIVGVFINGSTGEGVSLTLEEKMMLAKAWAESTKNDREFKIISLVGGTCLSDAIALAKHAKEIGLFGIALTAPFYFKPIDIQQLAECCFEVGRSVSDLPFYYYHIPSLNGVNFPMIELLKEVDGKMKNFAGIKYTNEDFMDFLGCLNFKNGKYDMLWGRDENLLSALVLGAKGAVGSTYNYAAPLYYQIMKSFSENDLPRARSLQQKAIEMIELLRKYGGIATGKAFMKIIGIDCGWFRLPIRNLSLEQFDSFKRDVQKIGFDHFRSKLI